MSDIEVVRRAFEEVASYPQVALVPEGPSGWTTARFGLGPLPARVVLDAGTRTIRAQVALLGFPTAAIEEAMGNVPYPSPEVHITLAPDVPPILEYAAPFARFNADEGVGLIAACAMYSVALLEQLFPDLDRSVRKSYTKAGFKQRRGFGGDARDLLRTAPVAYEPWDRPVARALSEPRAIVADDRNPRAVSKAGIPRGHRCDDLADLVEMLEWWHEQTTEPVIAGTRRRAVENHVLFAVDGVECVLGGLTTRSGVAAMLEIFREDKRPYLSVTQDHKGVRRRIGLGVGQYADLDGVDIRTFQQLVEPRWLTESPVVFSAARAAAGTEVGQRFVTSLASRARGRVGAVVLDEVMLHSSSNLAVFASLDANAVRVVLPKSELESARRTPGFLYVDDLGAPGVVDAVLDLEAAFEVRRLTDVVSLAIEALEWMEKRGRPEPVGVQSSAVRAAGSVDLVELFERALLTGGGTTLDAGRGYVQWQGVPGEGLLLEASDGGATDQPMDPRMVSELAGLAWRRPDSDSRNSWCEFVEGKGEAAHQRESRLKALAEQVGATLALLYGWPDRR